MKFYNFVSNGFFMITTQQAYCDYLQKEKNYSPHTLTAYLKDVAEFENFLKTHDADAALETVV